MQLSTIRRTVVTLGAVATLAVGTGALPGMKNVSTAQAAELAQHGGGHGGGGGNVQNLGSGSRNSGVQNSGNNGSNHNGGNNNGFQNNGGNNHNSNSFHNNGGGFGGHQFRANYGFSHQYWGWGYHRFYPQYYVTYYYEPVSICETYYFDDDDGAWYCFTGY
jgi:hypothetical protein